MANAELLLVELFPSRVSLDDELKVAHTVIHL